MGGTSGGDIRATQARGVPAGAGWWCGAAAQILAPLLRFLSPKPDGGSVWERTAGPRSAKPAGRRLSRGVLPPPGGRWGSGNILEPRLGESPRPHGTGRGDGGAFLGVWVWGRKEGQLRTETIYHPRSPVTNQGRRGDNVQLGGVRFLFRRTSPAPGTQQSPGSGEQDGCPEETLTLQH